MPITYQKLMPIEMYFKKLNAKQREFINQCFVKQDDMLVSGSFEEWLENHHSALLAGMCIANDLENGVEISDESNPLFYKNYA